jgi:hypothetical protein
MGHIVVIALALSVGLGFWCLARWSPGVLARVLPHTPIFIFGAALFTIAIFSAYFGSYGLKDPNVMLRSFVQGFVGLWFMLLPASINRGTVEHEQYLRRVFAMVAILMAVIIGSLYVESMQIMASMNLILIAAAYVLMTRYPRITL